MPVFGKSEPETVEVQGRPLRCQVCDSDTFWRREAQLHTALGSFFNVEWAAPTCVCLVCSSCGYIHWFLPQGSA